MRLGLPQLLLLLAAIAAVIGVRRLPRRSTGRDTSTKQALLIWFLLLIGGLSIWLLAAFR